MKVTYKSGIHVTDRYGSVVLDPGRIVERGVVTHAHMDHLVKGSLMTPATRDIMHARTGSSEAETLDFDTEMHYGGFKLVLRQAGHVLGSAMVRLHGNETDLLYTGDINPEGGRTCGPARPEKCGILVIEATYGGHDLPPREQVLEDLRAWIASSEGIVAIGAYEFGKSQEIMAAVQDLGLPVYTTPKIAQISDVYRSHGIDLRYGVMGEGELPDGPHIAILSSGMFKQTRNRLVKKYRKMGARTAFVSGWCNVFDYTRRHGLDAQFPVSDHGDRSSLLKFVKDCSPEKVFTVFGATLELARDIRETLGIESQVLR
jgi:Cft2 family RNA processing exonuclease